MRIKNYIFLFDNLFSYFKTEKEIIFFKLRIITKPFIFTLVLFNFEFTIRNLKQKISCNSKFANELFYRL